MKLDYNEEIEFVEYIGDYGEILCKNVVKSFVDNDGDIQNYATYVYNIKLKNNSLISDEWFDIYEYDCNGNCIIGFTRHNIEFQQLSNIPMYCSGKMLCRKYTYRYGAVNSNGILSVKPIYDRLTFNNENSYTAYYNGSLGYIDSITGEHITPIVFSHAQPFFENKAAVEFNGVMGYVDRNRIMRSPNNEKDYAIAPKYDTADNFENGYAKVSLNGQSYSIDKDENVYLSNSSINSITNKKLQFVKIDKINQFNLAD